MIDHKFKFVATNPCKGTVYTEENAIIFCAKDAAVPKMLNAYVKICKELGCASEHMESIELMRDRVIKYQRDIDRRIPDTDTDCEIDRCIGGDV